MIDKIMEDIRKNVKQLQIEDWAMIIFFASRFFTAIFYVLFGQKGIFITVGLLCTVILLSLIKKIRERNFYALYYFLIIALSIIILSTITMIFNPSTKPWIMSFNNGILIKTFDPRKGVFAALTLLLVRNTRRIVNNFKISSLIMFFYLIAQIALYYLSGSWINYYMLRDETSVLMPYNMSLGYEMIFVAIVFFSTALQEKKMQYGIMGIIAFCISFYFGSRGIVIPVGAFLFLSFIFNSKKMEKKLLVRGLLIALCFFILFIFVVNKGIKAVTQPTNPVVASNNAVEKQVQSKKTTVTKDENRNIDMLLSNKFTESNGRDIIWKISWNAIKEKFPFGYGVYGDRPFVGPRFRWGYSHNIFLEVIISFGFLGLLSIIGLGFFVFKSLIKSKYLGYRQVLIILLSMNSKLLISDSFWHFGLFWALIAYIIIIQTGRSQNQEFEVTNVLEGRVEILNSDKRILNHHKRHIITSLILLCACIGLLSTFIYFEVKGMKYKTTRFKEPTVVVALENSNEEFAKMKNKNLLAELPITLYSSDPSYLDQEQDSKDKGRSPKCHVLINKEKLEEGKALDETLKYLQTKSDEQSYSLIKTDTSEIHPNTVIKLGKFSDSIVMDKKPNGNYFYRFLKQSDYLQLYSLDASISSLNESRRKKYVFKQIDLAKRNNALILIHFKNINDGNNLTANSGKSTDVKYFLEIIEYLKSNNFKFSSMENLLEKSAYAQNEKTLLNLIRNSDIYRAIKQ